MVGLPVHSLHNYQTFFSLKKRILSFSVLGGSSTSHRPPPAHRDMRGGQTQPLPYRGYRVLPSPGWGASGCGSYPANGSRDSGVAEGPQPGPGRAPGAAGPGMCPAPNVLPGQPLAPAPRSVLGGRPGAPRAGSLGGEGGDTPRASLHPQNRPRLPPKKLCGESSRRRPGRRGSPTGEKGGSGRAGGNLRPHSEVPPARRHRPHGRRRGVAGGGGGGVKHPENAAKLSRPRPAQPRGTGTASAAAAPHRAGGGGGPPPRHRSLKVISAN